MKLAGLRGMEEAELKRGERKNTKQTQSNTQDDHLLNGLKKLSFTSFLAEGKLLVYGCGFFGVVSVFSFFLH